MAYYFQAGKTKGSAFSLSKAIPDTVQILLIDNTRLRHPTINDAIPLPKTPFQYQICHPISQIQPPKLKIPSMLIYTVLSQIWLPFGLLFVAVLLIVVENFQYWISLLTVLH